MVGHEGALPRIGLIPALLYFSFHSAGVSVCKATTLVFVHISLHLALCQYLRHVSLNCNWDSVKPYSYWLSPELLRTQYMIE
jgi:membrane-associated PAP2 superfamily phosphatase